MTHKPLASYYGRRDIALMRVATPLAALALALCGCQSPDVAWQKAVTVPLVFQERPL